MSSGWKSACSKFSNRYRLIQVQIKYDYNVSCTCKLAKDRILLAVLHDRNHKSLKSYAVFPFTGFVLVFIAFKLKLIQFLFCCLPLSVICSIAPKLQRRQTSNRFSRSLWDSRGSSASWTGETLPGGGPDGPVSADKKYTIIFRISL